MFDVGMSELLLVGVVALVVLKPSDWSRLLNRLGYYWHQLQKWRTQLMQYIALQEDLAHNEARAAAAEAGAQASTAKQHASHSEHSSSKAASHDSSFR